jgi:hypothetical protein
VRVKKRGGRVDKFIINKKETKNKINKKSSSYLARVEHELGAARQGFCHDHEVAERRAGRKRGS